MMTPKIRPAVQNSRDLNKTKTISDYGNLTKKNRNKLSSYKNVSNLTFIKVIIEIIYENCSSAG